MEIVTSTEGGAAVLELKGNLTIGAADSAFSEAVEGVIARDRNVIVLDLAHVDFIDSTGLGSLVRTHHRCTQSGGELRLAHVGYQIWKLLEAARISEIIQAYETRRQAVQGRRS